MGKAAKRHLIILFCLAMSAFFTYQYTTSHSIDENTEILTVAGGLDSFNYYRKLNSTTSDWDIHLKNFKCYFNVKEKYLNDFSAEQLQLMKQGEELIIGVAQWDGLRLQQQGEKVYVLSIKDPQGNIILSESDVIEVEQASHNINLYFAIGFALSALVLMALIRFFT